MTERAKTEVLISQHQIAVRVATLANEIAAALPKDMTIVSLLRGSFVFTADLIRALHAAGAQPQVEFMTLASYGRGTTSSGTVEIVRDMTESVEGRDVLIVDDILESGRTLTFARDLITGRGAKSVRIAVLLEKPGKRAVEIDADFVGFVVEDKFVVGYGLDYANRYRELPFIGVITA
ncbi:MAG: hypoxanthine phosphoribosyltransferase [Alphaproteobacteria bacterium]|nr:hypoxanthine phosphoribosyltransferase [Alphaproteobacteria bacterium]